MLKSNKKKEELYKETIKSYDAVAEQFSKKHAKDARIEKLILNFLNKFIHKPYILDAGCGPGRDINIFNKHNVDIVGIDISNSMVSEAKQNTNNKIYLMDIRDIDFYDSTFDGVWANASLHHLDKKDLGISFFEFHRIIKQKGYLFVSVKRGHKEFLDIEYPNNPRYFKKYCKSELCKIANKNGFKFIWSNFTSNSEKNFTWIEMIFQKEPEKTAKLTFDCKFCDLLIDTDTIKHPIYNKNIIESDKFIVLNALGQLVPGYFLIISKEHHPCFGAMSKAELIELEDLKRTIRIKFEKLFGEYSFFEHGSSSMIKNTGASIIHAHLHASPVPETFINDVRNRFESQNVANIISTIDIYKVHESYLYLEDKNKNAEIFLCNDLLPSQFLRRILSRHVGKLGQWDWKNYPHFQNITRTIELIDENRI